jgi:hypothetical protein
MALRLFPGKKQENQKYKITKTIVTAEGLTGEKKKHHPVSRWHSAVVNNGKDVFMRLGFNLFSYVTFRA